MGLLALGGSGTFSASGPGTAGVVVSGNTVSDATAMYVQNQPIVTAVMGIISSLGEWCVCGGGGGGGRGRRPWGAWSTTAA